jgi:dolichyl-phosphate beta-glucosyltransferase
MGQPFELIVIDDGSSDGTAQLVQSIQAGIKNLILISYASNRGKGYAVRMGVREARGKHILFMDADLSTPINFLDGFLSCLENGFPIVIGTRKHAAARILQHQPTWREWMGRMFTRISNAILGLHNSDFTCGFKAFHREVAKKIFGLQKIDRWAFDSEVLFLARFCGYPVAEVPVSWINSSDTKVRIVRDTITSFFSLWKIRWNAMTGKYGSRVR